MKINFQYYNARGVLSLSIICICIYFLVNKLVDKVVKSCEIWKDINDSDLKILFDVLGIFSPFIFLWGIIEIINKWGWTWIINKWILKWKIFKPIVDLPNLNGRYVGTLTSNFKDEDKKQISMQCVIEITQNASSIAIWTYFAEKENEKQTSKSQSICEKIIKESNGGFSLYYIFENKPDHMSENLYPHTGAAKLEVLKNSDKVQLKGEYYNNRSYKGTIDVTFLQKELLRKFN